MKRSAFIAVLFFIQNCLWSQTIGIDSAEPVMDSAVEILALETPIPANDIYRGNWNNQYVRLGNIDTRLKTDTTLIVFNTPESHFTFPCDNSKVISGFGFRGSRIHSGIDLKQAAGAPIYAVFDGKVRLARYYRGYGNVIVVRHFNGLETVYAHLLKIKVKINQDVKSGDIIGLAGRTGHATTNHLHFETRFLGEAFNPSLVIDFDNNKLISDTLVLTGKSFIINTNSRDTFVNGNGSSNTAVNNTKPTDSVVATNPPLKQEKPANQPPAKVFHTIKKGDTLYSLARKNGTSVDHICKLNHITPKTILKPGKVLRIK
jgi:murein DD-endopeptidase MepM/ murein hydrolase activator NlpD